jgi:hypothetical protein
LASEGMTLNDVRGQALLLVRKHPDANYTSWSISKVSAGQYRRRMILHFP